MLSIRNRRFTKSINILVTLWFTVLTTNALSMGTWLSPIAKGPSKDYAACQCCCAEHGGCSAECTCGGDPAKENQTALRSCSGSATPGDSTFVWVSMKFIPAVFAQLDNQIHEYPLWSNPTQAPNATDAKAPLKIPIAA